MAITKTPKKKALDPSTVANEADEAKTMQLISQGGTPAKGAAKRRGIKNVQLRLTEEVLEVIDAAIEKRSAIVRPSRHTWLLEAIAEKLEREAG